MDEGKNKLFSEDFIKEHGIETAPAEEQVQEGQEQAAEGVEQPQTTDTKEVKQETTAEGEQPTKGEQETTEAKEEAEKEAQAEKEIKKPEFDINTLNQFFEKDFKDTDEIKGVFESVEKIKDYDEKVQKLEEYENTLREKDTLIAELKESVDPLQYFTDEAALKASMLKKQFPDKDPVIIEKLMKGDLSKIKDFDMLVYGYLMDNPGLEGNMTRAANVLMDELGIDPEENSEEWSTVLKDKILVRANKARQEFNKLASEVKMPEVLTPEDRLAQKEQMKAELKKSWDEPLNRIAQYEKEAIADDEGNTLFEFDVPDEFKGHIKEYVEGMVLSGDLPVNEETLRFIEQDIRKNMIAQNLPKILKIYKSQLESQWQEDKDKEEGNTEPPNKATATDTQVETGKYPTIQDMLNSNNEPDTIG